MRFATIAIISVALATASLGCNRGGTTLTGAQAVAAAELPADDAKAWLDQPMRLADHRGDVVLIEAFHPS